MTSKIFYPNLSYCIGKLSGEDKIASSGIISVPDDKAWLWEVRGSSVCPNTEAVQLREVMDIMVCRADIPRNSFKMAFYYGVVSICQLCPNLTSQYNDRAVTWESGQHS